MHIVVSIFSILCAKNGEHHFKLLQVTEEHPGDTVLRHCSTCTGLPLRSEGHGKNEPCPERTGKSTMDWNLLLLTNKKPQLVSAEMKTRTLPWQPATTAAVSDMHWQLSSNISWTLKTGLVAFYDIRPGNGVGLFLQPRSPHRAASSVLWHHRWVTGRTSGL